MLWELYMHVVSNAHWLYQNTVAEVQIETIYTYTYVME